jgi:hypothetical protein
MKKMKKMKKNRFTIPKRIFIMGLYMIFISCTVMAQDSKDNEDGVWISGKVINHNKNNKILTFKPFSILPVDVTMTEWGNNKGGCFAPFEIEIEDDGTFDGTAVGASPGYYVIGYNVMADCALVYVGGKTNKIKFDVINTRSTTASLRELFYNDYVKYKQLKLENFEGEDALINIYLQKKRIFGGYDDDENDYFMKEHPEKEILSELQNWKKETDSLLKNSGIKDKFFLKLESKNIYYKYFKYLSEKIYVDNNFSYFSSTPEKSVISPIFRSELEKFDFNDIMAFSCIHEYHMLSHIARVYILRKKYLASHPKIRESSLTAEDFDSFFDTKSYLTLINEKITNERIKNYLLHNHEFRSILRSKTKNDFSEEEYKLALKYLTNEHFKKDLETTYQRKKLAWKGIENGRISPRFENYENDKGGTTSLKDFKGKYVLIYAWEPC